MNNRKFISQWEKIFCNKNIRIISIGEHYHIHPKAIRYQVSPRSAHAPAQANSPIQFKLFSAAATLVSLVEKSRQPQHQLDSLMLVLARHSLAPGLNCLEFDMKIISRVLTLHFWKDVHIPFQLNHAILSYILHDSEEKSSGGKKFDLFGNSSFFPFKLFSLSHSVHDEYS